QAAINRYLDEHNQAPEPFTPTADPDKIIAAVKRGHQVLRFHPLARRKAPRSADRATQPLSARQRAPGSTASMHSNDQPSWPQHACISAVAPHASGDATWSKRMAPRAILPTVYSQAMALAAVVAIAFPTMAEGATHNVDARNAACNDATGAPFCKV